MAYLKGPYMLKLERITFSNPNSLLSKHSGKSIDNTSNSSNEINLEYEHNIMSEKERAKLNKEAEECLKEVESKLSLLKSSLISFQERSNELQIESDHDDLELHKARNQLLDHHTLMLLFLVDFSCQVSKYYYDQQSERLNSSIEERQAHTARHQLVLSNRRHSRQQNVLIGKNFDPIQERDISHVTSSEQFHPLKKQNKDDQNGQNQPLKETEDKVLPHRRRSDIQKEDFGNPEFSGKREFVENERTWRINHGLGDVDDSVEQIEPALKTQLQMENMSLLSELETMCDNIRAVERQVAMISQAHQIIAHNLMQQRDDLEHIHHQTKDAAVTVSRGNNELEKTAQNSSKLRLLVLTVVLVCSFLLLLLHYLEP